MLYRLVIDGIDYLDFQQSDLILLKPKLELEISQAGNLEFTLPPYHRYYDGLHILTSTVEVYEDDRLIWYGRPVEQKVDFYKQKTIYCEGPLSFFNDTVQVPYTYNEVELSRFFSDVLTYHNRWVAKDRRFEIGEITIDDQMVYRKIDYESTYDVLKGMCLDTVDGYFFFRRENGINYIDWVKDIPYSCNQTIEFGINLLDYASDFDATEFATCILPIGKTVNQDEGPITIWSVNNNSDVLESEAVNEFGRVTRVQRWSEIEDPTELKAEAQRYLDNTQFNSLIIECNAADLHSLNNEQEIFQLGQNVHVLSNPHFIDRDFPISKMTINLDSAAKTITLGILKKKTLTRIYKEDTEPSQDDYGYDDGYDDWPGTWTDDDGNPWVLVPPSEPGGPVTATKMPTHITVAREPNKMNYKDGETIDFTGLLVRIWCNDKVWTGDGRSAYKDGHAPMRELSFSSKRATLMPVVSEMDNTIAITWKYKGKEYKTKLVIHVGEGSRPDTGPIKSIGKATTGHIFASNEHRKEYGFTAGTGYMTKILISEHDVYHIYASANSGTVCFGNSVAGGSERDVYNLTSKYTYAGKTVYYHSGPGHWYGKIVELSPVCNNGAITTGVTDNIAKAVAWCMIYG